MEPFKTCPHCKILMRRGEEGWCLVKQGKSDSVSNRVLPVTYLWCPGCGYLELYSLRVVGQV